MNYVFDTNIAATSMSQVVERLVNKARDAGWSVVRFSDGSSVSTTDQDLSSGTLNGTDRWVVIQQPSGGSAPFSGSRQFLFWRRSSDRHWCINYSRNGSYTGDGTGFVSGTLSTPPSGTSSSTPAFNEKGVLQDSARSSVEVFQSSNGPADRNYIFQVGFDQDSPFSWYAFGYPQASGSSMVTFFVGSDAMATGTFALDAGNVTANTTDLDPYLHSSAYYNYTVSNVDPIVNTGQGQRRAFKAAGQAGESWVDPSNASRTSSFVNHVTGKIDLVPIQIGGSANSMFKGILNSWRYSASNQSNLVVFDGTVDRINISNVAVPWDISVTPTP